MDARATIEDWLYDTAPPKYQRFSLTKVSWLLDKRKAAIKSRSPYVSGLQRTTTLSSNDVGVARGNVFQENWPGAALKTGDFVKEKMGGLRQ